MDRYQASVLNRITDRHGPGWTIIALAIMYRWSIAATLGGTGTAFVTARALGWF